MLNAKLKRFMHALSGEQQAKFAYLAGTSVGTIRHYVTGRRVPSAAAAIALEKAADRMRGYKDMGELPPLGRGDLSEACRGCEFRRACMGKMS